MPTSEIAPGPGEGLVSMEEIDTANVHLEGETPMDRALAPSGPEMRAVLDEKEALNQEIIKALRDNLENPVFAILIVRMFNLGGALYDAGLDKEMPPLHRLLIGSVVLVVVIGATNPDVVEKIASKWRKVVKSKALHAPAQPEVTPADA